MKSLKSPLPSSAIKKAVVVKNHLLCFFSDLPSKSSNLPFIQVRALNLIDLSWHQVEYHGITQDLSTTNFYRYEDDIIMLYNPWCKDFSISESDSDEDSDEEDKRCLICYLLKFDTKSLIKLFSSMINMIRVKIAWI